MSTAAPIPDGRPLYRDPQFLKFWLGQAIGEMGGAIAGLALSLTAVLVLSADAMEMGVLAAVRNLPYLAVGLLAGVIVDRLPRRRVLVATLLGQAAVLALIPLAERGGLLRIELLYVVAFGAGALMLITVVAAQSLLPVLTGRHRLVAANSYVHLSAALALIAGPALAGVLVEVFGAPVTVLVAALCALPSALLLLWMHAAEPAPVVPPGGRSVVAEIREGLHIIVADRHLFAITLAGTTHNICQNGMLTALYVLFAADALGLSAAEIGLVLAAGGPGAMIGSVLATRITSLAGIGPVVGAAQVLTGVARLALPLAAVFGPAVVVLAAGEFLLGFARSVFNINQLSLRQAVTPDHQQGRMNASIRFVMWSGVPLGALFAGWLGSVAGLMAAIWVGIAGTFAAALWIYASPVRSLRTAPSPPANSVS